MVVVVVEEEEEREERKVRSRWVLGGGGNNWGGWIYVVSDLLVERVLHESKSERVWWALLFSFPFY